MANSIETLNAQIAAQAARIEQLTAESVALKQTLTSVCDHDYEPEYHSQGMGCGLEDRGITDRYDAMEYGWNEAMERVYSEVIPAIDEIETPATDAALREIQVQVWRDALVLAKSAISTDSQDHIDFLFNGKVEQVLAGEVQL